MRIGARDEEGVEPGLGELGAQRLQPRRDLRSDRDCSRSSGRRSGGKTRSVMGLLWLWRMQHRWLPRSPSASDAGPLDDQRRPVATFDVAAQRATLHAVGADDARRLGLRMPGEHDSSRAAPATAGRSPARALQQRAGEDVGDDQVVGRVVGDHRLSTPVASTASTSLPTPFWRAFSAAVLHRDRIDVARDHRDGAGAWRCAMARTPVPVPTSSARAVSRACRDAVDRLEAAGGGFVVAGAEGLGRIDPDRRQAGRRRRRSSWLPWM